MEEFLQNLKTLYPRDRLFLDPAQKIPYESDGLTAFRVSPEAVVLPLDTNEVIETVRLCHKHKIPFVARGSGTSLSGGSLPVKNGIVIGLNRLNRILEVNPENRTARVEPGVVNLDVSKAAAPYNLYYAPDPSSQPICTIGGNVAFNAGGAHCLKQGMTSNHVLGLKAVLPDGEVVELGRNSLENTGPDHVGLYVGNEGLFGVVLELTLRLIPRPETTRTILAAYSSLEAAGNAVSLIVASGILPAAMEIMDRLALEAAEAAVNAGYPKDAASILIVELDGESHSVEADFIKLQKALDESKPTEIRIAQNDTERFLIWKGRKSAFSAVGRLSPDYLVQDGVVPRGKLGQALGEIEKLARDAKLRVANVFHAGDGNLHPLILFDGRKQGELERAEALAAQMLDMCVRYGGSITGEHGIGMEKRDHLGVMYGEEEMDLFRELRKSIDPDEISNTGKMFLPPDHKSGKNGKKKRKAAPVENGVKEFQAFVVDRNKVFPVGGGSKPHLMQFCGEFDPLDTTGLTGITEYEPAEYTVTVRAGTPLTEIVGELSDNGQYLPFDPPFVGEGSTAGGLVATGISGPGRYRYGGIRDFVLGISFIDGRGRLLKGGGRVVKNAAGFDLSKFFIGSLGAFGVITSLTFKVFPSPESFQRIHFGFDSFPDAVQALAQLNRSSFVIDTLDLDGTKNLLSLKISGVADTFTKRIERLEEFIGQGTVERTAVEPSRQDTTRVKPLESSTRSQSWKVKVPLAPDQMEPLNTSVLPVGGKVTFHGGGAFAWLDWSQSIDDLNALLIEQKLSGLITNGPHEGPVLLGQGLKNSFYDRLKQVFDPDSKFLSLSPFSQGDEIESKSKS